MELEMLCELTEPSPQAALRSRGALSESLWDEAQRQAEEERPPAT